MTRFIGKSVLFIGKSALLFGFGFLLGAILFEFPTIIVVVACLCAAGLVVVSISDSEGKHS